MIETRNYQLPAGSAADPRSGETFQRGVVKFGHATQTLPRPYRSY